MAQTTIDFSVFDNYEIVDDFSIYVDFRWKMSIRDITNFDNGVPRNARSQYNYSAFIVKYPSGQTVVYGNLLKHDVYHFPPALLPSDIEIDTPKIGIYYIKYYSVPDVINGETYDTDDIIVYNKVFYKFLTSYTIDTSMIDQDLLDGKLEEISESDLPYVERYFYSAIAIRQCASRIMKSLFCKLQKDPNFNVCETQEYKDIVMVSASGLGSALTSEKTSIEINSENLQSYLSIFNYISKACCCHGC